MHYLSLGGVKGRVRGILWKELLNEREIRYWRFFRGFGAAGYGFGVSLRRRPYVRTPTVLWTASMWSTEPSGQGLHWRIQIGYRRSRFAV